MTDIIRYSPAVRVSRALSILSKIDAGVSPGKILLCSGVAPVGFAAATGVLASLSLSKPSGVVNDAAELMFAPVADAMVVTDGSVTWARVEDGAGNAVADLDVGLPGSGAAIILTDTSLKAGALIRVTLAKLIEP